MEEKLSDRPRNPQNLSLLDQIMAMILGGQSLEGENKQEHFERLRIEHETIVQEWIDFFGRLPISLVTSTKKKEGEDSGKPSKRKQAHTAECSVNTVDNALKSVDEPHEKMSTEHSNSVVDD